MHDYVGILKAYVIIRHHWFTHVSVGGIDLTMDRESTELLPETTEPNKI